MTEQIKTVLAIVKNCIEQKRKPTIDELLRIEDLLENKNEQEEKRAEGVSVERIFKESGSDRDSHSHTESAYHHSQHDRYHDGCTSG